MALTKAEGWWVDGVHIEDHGTVVDRAGWDDIPGMRGENVVLVRAAQCVVAQEALRHWPENPDDRCSRVGHGRCGWRVSVDPEGDARSV